MGGFISNYQCGGPVGRGRGVVGRIVVGVVMIHVGYRLYKRLYRKRRLAGEPNKANLTNKDVIYLLMPPRLGIVSNISPFAMKLETWFRLIDVPYQVVETTMPSARKQFPYIMLNGIETADTRFIVERVSKDFKIEIDPTLSDEDRSISLAFIRMLEENTLFTYAWYRVLFQPAEFWGLFSSERNGALAQKMLKFAPSIMKKAGRTKFWQQGISRHSPSEIYSLAEADLKALSNFLGTKDFFFGKEPTLLDCVAFGHLVQIFWLKLSFPPRFYGVKECKNLLQFLERMRDRLYPDWSDLCDPRPSG